MTSCSTTAPTGTSPNSRHSFLADQQQQQPPPRRESLISRQTPQQQQQPIIPPVLVHDDEDSLQDMLDSMIAETSAKWKSSVQTMQTSTMLHHAGWTTNNGPMDLPTTTPIAPLPLSRVSSEVEDLVRKQQEEIKSLRHALTTVTAVASSSSSSSPPPITHVTIPFTHHSLEDHDELTVDL